MESRSHALAAGLFVVVFVVAALAALWWFGGRHEATREVLVVSRHAVTGLGGQATVRYRGVRVGKVRDIGFDPQGSGDIHVRIVISDSAPVTERTVAKLAYQGVTGQAHLQLEDAADAKPLPQDGGALRLPLLPSLLGETIDTGVETLKEVREITVRLNALLAATDARKVARTLDHVERLAGHAADASEQLPDAIARLKRLASDENLGRLNVALRNAADSSGRMPALLDETKAVAVSLRAVADRLDGTLTRLDTAGLAAAPGRINALSEQVGQTVGNLDRLIRSLEESPQSLVFGRPAREPGPGEAGFGEKR